MPKLPWVSRELYERVKEDLRKSEDERKALLDRLLGNSGISPLQDLAEILPDPASKDAQDLVNTATGELSGAAIRRMAQDAANRRAGRLA